VFSRFLVQETIFRAIAEEITDVDIRYEMATDGGNHHPQLGRWAPNFTLQTDDGTMRVAELMRAGKGVLLDFSRRSARHEAVIKWADRVNMMSARCHDPSANFDAILVRPDGYVAWVLSSGDADQESERSLRAALERWFGAPNSL